MSKKKKKQTLEAFCADYLRKRGMNAMVVHADQEARFRGFARMIQVQNPPGSTLELTLKFCETMVAPFCEQAQSTFPIKVIP